MVDRMNHRHSLEIHIEWTMCVIRVDKLFRVNCKYLENNSNQWMDFECNQKCVKSNYHGDYLVCIDTSYTIISSSGEFFKNWLDLSHLKSHGVHQKQHFLFIITIPWNRALLIEFPSACFDALVLMHLFICFGKAEKNKSEKKYKKGQK